MLFWAVNKSLFAAVVFIISFIKFMLCHSTENNSISTTNNRTLKFKTFDIRLFVHRVKGHCVNVMSFQKLYYFVELLDITVFPRLDLWKLRHHFYCLQGGVQLWTERYLMFIHKQGVRVISSMRLMFVAVVNLRKV